MSSSVLTYDSLTDSPFRWIQEWDIELEHKNRRIALTLDNFSGHKIIYKPKYITLIFFEPGMTSHIQPLDAGIIRCFKAYYRRQFCLRAIQQDDTDEENIYDINLLDAMTMAERAWDSVSPTTIKNCWNHTEIQRPRLPIITLKPPRPPMPAILAAGWDLVVEFATNSWSIPEAHSALQARLGDQYIASEWNEPLDSASGAEGDVSAALAAVNVWRSKWAPDSAADFCDVPDSDPDFSEVDMAPDERNEIEEELLGLVAQLKSRRRISGQPVTLEELLDPTEEHNIGEHLDTVSLGDEEIVLMVRAHTRHDIEEIVDSNSDDDSPIAVPPPLNEMISACRMIEENGLLICTDVLDVVDAVRQFQGRLQKMSRGTEKQSTLDMFFIHN